MRAEADEPRAPQEHLARSGLLQRLLALIPLIVAGFVPGQEIEHPMAVVILGGLVTAALLNLFVVLSLYPPSSRAGGTGRRAMWPARSDEK